MLQRKRRVTVRLSVVATDAAGNSAQKRAPRIRLRASGRASRARVTRRVLPAGSVTATFSVSVVRLRLNSARRARGVEAHEGVGRGRGLDLGACRRRPRSSGAA